MTNELRNVPDLRFPGFEGEWEESNIDNEFDFFNNKRKPIKENLRNKGEYPYYGATGIIDYVDDFIFDGNFILIGEDGANIVSRSAPLVYFATGKFWVNNHAHILYPKFGDIYFNYLLLENIDYEKYNTGTAQPKLNVQNLKKIKIKSPRDNSEQQKIGKFFSKLDRQIELEEQKLAKLEEQKKGYMQKIFSQELRFKDDNGNDYPNWENEKLGDLINEVNERTTSNNQYVLLSSTKNGLLSQEEYFKKQIGSKDSTGYKILRLNQLVLSPQNLWLGNINFNQRFDIGIVSPSYRIYNLSHQFDINFAKDLLKSPQYIYEYAQASEQGASVVRRNLNLELFYSIKISLPSIEEQRKIGVFLNKLDKLIRKQYNKIVVLKQRKNGLLQKMFV
ncbi:restriction endonuclease subunit S [Staphylococcus arlettae]|uniref:restriction endonuclease subunit S n=1 Tax=Staphylococcus arlettae TaxID=29378 RepID=UPI001137D70B|nr:restriction endonuclease subunit S [Staphylococcus arlettae]BBK26861.1 restriction endonuclease subunit S [Staphylococcus arlettae]